MISKAQVIRENESYRTLINAVINRIGLESINDVINHGADCGFNGFIYYSDTHAFAMRYRKIIVRLLEEIADCMGEEVTTMVKNFGVFRNGNIDNEELKDLYKYLGGGRPEQGRVTNVLAWFALEEVCRMFDQ